MMQFSLSVTDKLLVSPLERVVYPDVTQNTVAKLVNFGLNQFENFTVKLKCIYWCPSEKGG